MVKQGYKQTEIGIIPEEWKTIVFKHCFNVLSNNTLSRSELNDNCGTVRNIHYGDILVQYDSILDCSNTKIPYINSPKKSLSSMYLEDGDIVIADTAEDETVGKAVEMSNVDNQQVVAGLHTIPCRAINKDDFAAGWLGYYINHDVYHHQLLPYITGTKVSAISKSAISNTVVLVPPIDEQKCIANALSDVDSMISSLEKLIAKKKAVKQGAMQELLTGKKRLLGFTGEWKKVRLKNIYENITTGKLDANAAVDSGKYRFYTCAREYAYIDEYAFDGEALLISGNGENVGYIHHYSGKFNAYQRTYVLMGFKCNVLYLKHYLDYLLPVRISLEVAKSNTPYIKKDTISDMYILMPKEDEQEAIASILSDMDNEIEALEQKLAKTRQLKQGMMQQLLTGKIRLL